MAFSFKVALGLDFRLSIKLKLFGVYLLNHSSTIFNPLSVNPTKWSHAFADELSVFDHFAGLALKGLNQVKRRFLYLDY